MHIKKQNLHGDLARWRCRMSGRILTSDAIRIRDQRAPGWYWIQNELIDVLARTAGVYAVAVYNVLSRHARADQVVGLSARKIADALGCSRSKVFDGLRDLEQHAIIARRPREGEETKYVLVDLKSEPVHNTDGSSCTGPVQNANGSRPYAGRANKEAKLKTEKGYPLPPSPARGGTSIPKCSEGLDPATAAKRVMESCGFGTTEMLNVLRDVIAREVKAVGGNLEPQQVGDTLIAEWQAYRESHQEFRYGARRFFGEGVWKTWRAKGKGFKPEGELSTFLKLPKRKDGDK